MAQLIKLQDYVSRYETDLSRYPSQFVRLKKQQWERLNAQRLAGPPAMEDFDDDEFGAEPSGNRIMNKLKGMFKRGQADELEAEEEPAIFKAGEDEENLNFQYPVYTMTEEELKQYFLDQLYRFQLKWASSTLTEKSIVDRHFYHDERMKYLLQSLPDSFLLLYRPIFLLKRAPIELDVLLLSPLGIWCLTFLDEKEGVVYLGDGGRFWLQRARDREKKVLNPLLSVNRMEKVVKQLLQLYEIDFPVHKAIVCRNGFIDYPGGPGDVQILDKRSFPDWFQRQRGNTAPLKSAQIRAASALLEYCQTTSFARLEWDSGPSQS